MKQLILFLSFLFLFASCGDDSAVQSSLPTIPITTPPPTIVNVAGDLTFIKGSYTLGKGINSSRTANQFINCTTPVAFLPFISKKWLIAFGGFPAGSYCGSGCSTDSINCQAGENVTISSTFYPVGSQAADSLPTPADYDAVVGGPIVATPDIVTVCPSSGKLEHAFPADNISSYLKVTVVTIAGTESEYLKCL